MNEWATWQLIPHRQSKNNNNNKSQTRNLRGLPW